VLHCRSTQSWVSTTADICRATTQSRRSRRRTRRAFGRNCSARAATRARTAAGLDSPLPTCAHGLASALPHLDGDWAHPYPHPHRDWAHPCRHICTEKTGRIPLPHLHRDRAVRVAAHPASKLCAHARAFVFRAGLWTQLPCTGKRKSVAVPHVHLLAIEVRARCKATGPDQRAPHATRNTQRSNTKRVVLQRSRGISAATAGDADHSAASLTGGSCPTCKWRRTKRRRGRSTKQSTPPSHALSHLASPT
jgi:hypothetical protein